MTLEALGWSEVWQRAFEPYAGDGLLPGRVVSEHRTHYQVATDSGELTAGTTGRLRNDAAQRSDLPGVGDFVAVRPAPDDGPATIEAILPRTSAIIRKASGEHRPQLLGANVDVVFIMTALDGDLNLPRLERYLALVRESGAVPVIVVNKADIDHDVTSLMAEIAAIAPGVPVHVISARGRTGIADLERHFAGNRTIALIGSSGVGKSTLTNQLLQRSAQATQEVRAHDNRGRHTTTHRQLFTRPGGGLIMDTPGMRGLERWNPTAVADSSFEDIEALALDCKFRNCSHGTERSCAVRAAVDRGDLTPEHLARYLAQPRPLQRWER
jgi:ribosome biogenesis GTPase / thiamine phosphate phosphatase